MNYNHRLLLLTDFFNFCFTIFRSLSSSPAKSRRYCSYYIVYYLLLLSLPLLLFFITLISPSW